MLKLLANAKVVSGRDVFDRVLYRSQERLTLLQAPKVMFKPPTGQRTSGLL